MMSSYSSDLANFASPLPKNASWKENSPEMHEALTPIPKNRGQLILTACPSCLVEVLVADLPRHLELHTHPRREIGEAPLRQRNAVTDIQSKLRTNDLFEQKFLGFEPRAELSFDVKRNLFGSVIDPRELDDADTGFKMNDFSEFSTHDFTQSYAMSPNAGEQFPEQSPMSPIKLRSPNPVQYISPLLKNSLRSLGEVAVNEDSFWHSAVTKEVAKTREGRMPSTSELIYQPISDQCNDAGRNNSTPMSGASSGLGLDRETSTTSTMANPKKRFRSVPNDFAPYQQDCVSPANQCATTACLGDLCVSARSGSPIEFARIGETMQSARSRSALEFPGIDESMHAARSGSTHDVPRLGETMQSVRSRSALDFPIIGETMQSARSRNALEFPGIGETMQSARPRSALDFPEIDESMHAARSGSPIDFPRIGETMQADRSRSALDFPRIGETMQSARSRGAHDVPTIGGSMQADRSRNALDFPIIGETMHAARSRSPHDVPTIDESMQGDRSRNALDFPTIGETMQAGRSRSALDFPIIGETMQTDRSRSALEFPGIDESTHAARPGSSLNFPRIDETVPAERSRSAYEFPGIGETVQAERSRSAYEFPGIDETRQVDRSRNPLEFPGMDETTQANVFDFSSSPLLNPCSVPLISLDSFSSTEIRRPYCDLLSSSDKFMVDPEPTVCVSMHEDLLELGNPSVEQENSPRVSDCFTGFSPTHTSLDISMPRSLPKKTHLLQETHTTVTWDATSLMDLSFYESTHHSEFSRTQVNIRSSIANESSFIEYQPADLLGEFQVTQPDRQDCIRESATPARERPLPTLSINDVRQSKLAILKAKHMSAEAPSTNELIQCPHCGRKFSSSALERHLHVCVRVFGCIRDPVDFRSKRAKNTPLEYFHGCVATSPVNAKDLSFNSSIRTNRSLRSKSMPHARPPAKRPVHLSMVEKPPAKYLMSSRSRVLQLPATSSSALARPVNRKAPAKAPGASQSFIPTAKSSLVGRTAKCAQNGPAVQKAKPECKSRAKMTPRTPRISYPPAVTVPKTKPKSIPKHTAPTSLSGLGNARGRGSAAKQMCQKDPVVGRTAHIKKQSGVSDGSRTGSISSLQSKPMLSSRNLDGNQLRQKPAASRNIRQTPRPAPTCASTAKASSEITPTESMRDPPFAAIQCSTPRSQPTVSSSERPEDAPCSKYISPREAGGCPRKDAPSKYISLREAGGCPREDAPSKYISPREAGGCPREDAPSKYISPREAGGCPREDAPSKYISPREAWGCPREDAPSKYISPREAWGCPSKSPRSAGPGASDVADECEWRGSRIPTVDTPAHIFSQSPSFSPWSRDTAQSRRRAATARTAYPDDAQSSSRSSLNLARDAMKRAHGPLLTEAHAHGPLLTETLPSDLDISPVGNKSPVLVSPASCFKWATTHLSPDAAFAYRKQRLSCGDWPGATVSSRLIDLQEEMSRLEDRLIRPKVHAPAEKALSQLSAETKALTERVDRLLQRSPITPNGGAASLTSSSEKTSTADMSTSSMKSTHQLTHTFQHEEPPNLYNPARYAALN